MHYVWSVDAVSPVAFKFSGHTFWVSGIWTKKRLTKGLGTRAAATDTIDLVLSSSFFGLIHVPPTLTHIGQPGHRARGAGGDDADAADEPVRTSDIASRSWLAVSSGQQLIYRTPSSLAHMYIAFRQVHCFQGQGGHVLALARRQGGEIQERRCVEHSLFICSMMTTSDIRAYLLEDPSLPYLHPSFLFHSVQRLGSSSRACSWGCGRRDWRGQTAARRGKGGHEEERPPVAEGGSGRGGRARSSV